MRKAVFIATVGSTNYNLKTPSSDVDKKLFVYPTFEDLYKGEKLSKSKTTELEDTEEHDIRKLPQMLWKSNVNFIEVLFSQEYTLSFAPGAVELVEKLIERREEIARMNLPYLFDACFGMFLGKKKGFHRDSFYDMPGKFDVSRINKHAYAALRITSFISRYYETDFKEFGSAIYYDDNDSYREALLSVKNGSYRGAELSIVLDEAEKTMKMYEGICKSQPKNEELNIWVNNAVQEAVTQNIKNELEEK